MCPVRSTSCGGREGTALSSIPTASNYRGERTAPPSEEGPAPPSPRQTDGWNRGEAVVETPLSPPDRSEDLTISWRRQILQSEAESQRIAVRKLLNRLQHPGWYVSHLQTIRCGYTACGG